MGFPKHSLAPALPLCNTVAKIAVLSGKTRAVLEDPTCSMFLTVHFPEISAPWEPGTAAATELGLLPVSVALLWG